MDNTQLDKLIASYSDELLKQNTLWQSKGLTPLYEEKTQDDINEEISNREHVRNIKNMKKDIDLNICPRCGSNLVLRRGIGKKFYGCSTYPKCKFTKKF